ncbi:MAG: glycoside hydrolase family 26 protein, partial [Planctomycetota bacterium]
ALGSRVITLVLYEFESPAEAAFFLAADERLMRIKDAKMAKGALRILDSSYRKLDEAGASGLIAEKTVAFGGQEIPVLTVVAVRGRLAAELVFSNQKASKAGAARAVLDALGGARSLESPSEHASPGEEEPRDPPEFGLYRMYWSRGGYGSRLASWTREFRTPPRYVMFYRDLGRLAYPRSGIDGIRSIGAVPIISLELWNWGAGKTAYLPRILAGDYDEALRGWAEAAAADGGRILLRFGFECNGDWFSWSGDPPAYVSAWRHAHKIFEEAGAGNVEWVWSPNAVSIPRTKENAISRYYPGDDVVDWVGLDGYNFGDNHDKWHTWESFKQVFDRPLEEFRKRYPGKPVIIAETGAASDERKAEWIRRAWDYLATRPEVRAVVWFDLDKRREGEPDWRIGSSPGSLEAFNETFAAPHGEPGETERVTPSTGVPDRIINRRSPQDKQEKEQQEGPK